MRKIINSFILMTMLATAGWGAETAINFSLRNLDGDLIRLENYLGRGPIIIDFWATWCKPCVKNLSKLQKLYDEYKDQGLIILAINEDGPRSLSKVEPFAKSLGLEFPILLDENRDVALKYQVSGFPTTLVIDTNKEIVLSLRGYRPGDEENIRVKIEQLMGKDIRPK